jgi:imidazole glycerol phosphate synthase glutamine amidotransferase subunit
VTASPFIVRTGVANLASVVAAFRRLGVEPAFSSRPEEVASAEAVVLPGVGAFEAAMHALRAAGLDAAIRDRVLAGRPTLCVCLGLQLLCEGSEEAPRMSGLGVIPHMVTRYPDSVRVPQLGWNRVEPEQGCRMLVSGYGYFANSYRLADAPTGWEVAWSDHGGRFVAAMERDGVLACQFHLELSGPWGLSLLGRWLDARTLR